MAGGKGGSLNYTRVVFNNGRDSEIFGKAARFPLHKNDVAKIITGTGGGYGDPMTRSIEQVQDDVKNGYITLAMAEQDYGLVLDPDTLAVEKLVNGRKN
jgi:N-methylhydantoinase B